jgi:CRISPR-associated protein Csm2
MPDNYQNRGQQRPAQNQGGGQGNANRQDDNSPFVAKCKCNGDNDINIPFNPEWITRGIDTNGICYAEEFGKHLAGGGGNFNMKLTTSQLRNFFGEVRRIQTGKEFNEMDFLLLKPKLAYATGRQGGMAVKPLKLVLDLAHAAVFKVEEGSKPIEARFKNFVNFFEAVLAYHKGYGGKDSKK